MLLFGGESNPDFVFWDDLWAFSPEKGKWTELKPEGKKPSIRTYFGSCFDTKRNRMWVHGGFNGKMLDDLWFFDSEKDTWKEVEVKGDKPSPRDGHDLYYNAKTDELILFGGLLDFTTFELNDELWVFTIGKSTWSKKKKGPSARLLYCGALDLERQRIYVTGGFGEGGTAVSGELWTYDIAEDAWTKSKDEVANHAAGRMVHVPDLDRLFIFGGADTHDELWYDLKTEKWSTTDKAAPPPGRSYGAMCLDPDGRRIYMFGGTTGGFLGKHVPDDLWVFKLPPKPEK
jgi:hypothetical protein